MSTKGLILCEGNGRLPAAIAERLATAGETVERIVLGEHAPAENAAQLARASVLVLATEDDPGNVDTALWARKVRADLPLVARIFDDALAGYLSGQVERLTILSMSQIAAPLFVEAATKAARAPSAASRPRRARGGARRPDRVLLGAIAGLAMVVAPATAFFARTLHLRAIDALYFVWTTVMTVGYGDISLRDASDGTKLVGMLLMLAGAAFMAALFAILTGWVVTQRLDVMHGRVRVRGHGHVVVIGAGNLGFRVAGLLAARGPRVVVIERDEDSRNLSALRAAGHHVIVADAAREPILDLAGVERASAVLVLTDSDAVNLQITLTLRALGVPAPVLKMVSPELSAHVTERGDGIALSPISAAAAAFCDAVVRRGVGD